MLWNILNKCLKNNLKKDASSYSMSYFKARILELQSTYNTQKQGSKNNHDLSIEVMVDLIKDNFNKVRKAENAKKSKTTKFLANKDFEKTLAPKEEAMENKLFKNMLESCQISSEKILTLSVLR